MVEQFEYGDCSEELSNNVTSNLKKYLQGYEAHLSSSPNEEVDDSVEEELYGILKNIHNYKLW